MKKYQLILLCTTLFITLFYEESLGVNVSILGISYASLILSQTPKKNRTRHVLLLFVTSILSSIAFAWFGDFASFLALFTSIFLFVFRSQNQELKSILIFPLFLINFITFIGRFFNFKEWLPEKKTSGMTQKLISVILIPTIFVGVFFGVYSLGSDHFSSFFTDWEFDLDLWEFVLLTFLGFFIAFNIWNFKLYNFLLAKNEKLENEFESEKPTQKSTYSFLDQDAERNSGVVSFLALNILLLVFILTFNYEQFFEIEKNPHLLSAETHERVNAVIFSIILAVCVIMFYFKGNFNFDKKATSLKILAKTWIVLNAVLVLSTVIKNSEYILKWGLTYKRLGVYSFLTLALIGLIFTFIKIHRRKKNAYLFNQMFSYFYATILMTSLINWGGIATLYNIKYEKAAYDDLTTFNFNEKILQEKFPKKDIIIPYFEEQNKGTFLSRILYYETLKKH